MAMRCSKTMIVICVDQPEVRTVEKVGCRATPN